MGKGGGSWWTREVGGAPHWLIVAVAALLVVLVGVPLSINLSRPAEAYTPKPRPSEATTSRAEVVAFIGDSYTAGAGRWPAMVADELGWVEANFGVGGSGYINGDAYIDRLDAVSLTHPDRVVIAGGRNDIWYRPADVEVAIGALVSAIERRFPDAEIIVINPWWDDDPAPDAFAPLTAAVQRSAEAAGARYLSTGEPLLGHTVYLSDDGVHPNESGQRALADAVLAGLSR